MAAQFCTYQLMKLEQLVSHFATFMMTFCVLHLICSLVATLANLLVIHALWKASSIPATIKKLFLSLAFSDFALGLIPQLMAGVIIAVMLRMAANENYNFDFLCPTIVTAVRFLMLLLSSASFLSVTAIAVDRLLAISLHLRYQELVTSKRVITALACLWITSGVAASVFISLPSRSASSMVVAVIEFVGILLTTVAYIRIYKIVRYHQHQIHSQHQLANPQAMELLREKKCAFNALFVYSVFLACYLPYLCTVMPLITDSMKLSVLVADQVSKFLVCLNSSLNPLVYCWRYREIREIVKSTMKKIFRINDTGP